MDQMFMNIFRGGFNYAFKFVMFTGIMLTASTATQAYRNKSSPFDCIPGGGKIMLSFSL